MTTFDTRSVPRRGLLKQGLRAVGALSALSWMPCGVAATPKRLVIATGHGDWGMPTPYLHLPRGPGFMVTSLVFDTLIWRGADGRFVGCLADSWDVSSDGLLADFRLNPHAKWHDGRPVTAEDVAFTIAYMRRHPYSFADVSPIASVQVEAADRLRMTLKRPYAPFLANLAGSVPILPRHVYAGIEDPLRFSAPEAAIGSGPFVFKSYDRAQKRYLFQAHVGYHRGRVAADELALLEMSPPAAAKGLIDGIVDMASDIDPAQVEALTAHGIGIVRYSSYLAYRLQFNTRKPPLSDPVVRRSIASAIDREALIRLAFRGNAEVWSAGGLAPRSEDPAGFPQYEFMPSRAARAVPPGTRLTLISSRQGGMLARVLAAQLTQAGVGIDLRLLDMGGARMRLERGDFDLALNWCSVMGDPQIMTRMVLGPQGEGYEGDPKLTDLLTRQVGELDAAHRAAMVREASLLYARDLPSFPLAAPIALVAHGPRLKPYPTPHGLGPGVPSVLNKLIFLT